VGAAVITAGYCAGIFDGEGSLTIRYSKKGRYTIAASVGMVDRRPPYYLHREFGGSLNPIKKKGNNRDITVWTLTGESVRQFLNAVKPFLIVKRRQAEIAERFMEVYYHPNVNRKRRPRAVLSIAAECRKEMMKLNRRGRPVEEPWETL
jgi:hypothetical protein